MDEKDLVLLKTLYKERNITKTAQVLYITQPALSHRIQNLEKYFNAKIITRGKKGVEFTSQGEYLVKFAIKTLLELQKTKERVYNIGHNVQGSLRLGVSGNFARYRLPMLLKQFIEIYPDVEIIVKTGWSSEVINFLYKDEVHIGFVRGDHHWHGPKYLLFNEPICIASNYEIDLEELPNLSRINYKTDPHLKKTIDNWWHSRFNRPSRITMDIGRIDTCLELVKYGLGYAIVPSISLINTDSLYTINLLSDTDKPILRETWMFNRETSLELSVVSAFVDFIKKNPFE
jgi:DNA-binding transcriptional LysR family regulator